MSRGSSFNHKRFRALGLVLCAVVENWAGVYRGRPWQSPGSGVGRSSKKVLTTTVQCRPGTRAAMPLLMGRPTDPWSRAGAMEPLQKALRNRAMARQTSRVGCRTATGTAVRGRGPLSRPTSREVYFASSVPYSTLPQSHPRAPRETRGPPVPGLGWPWDLR